MLLLRAGVLVAVASAALGSPLQGTQVRVPIDPSEYCSSCRVLLEPVVQLGPFGPDTLGSTSRLVRSADGRLVAIELSGERVAVFRPDGAVARVFRLGAVRRELGFVTAFSADPEDGNLLHIFAGSAWGRVTLSGDLRGLAVLAADPGEPAVHAALALPGDTVLIQADFRSPRLAGRPLHLVSDGRIVRTLDEQGTYRMDAPWETRRRLAHDGRGGYWTSRTNRYEVTWWSTSGGPEVVLERQVDWFRPWSALPSEGDLRPPTVLDLHVDARGRLWVHSSVPTGALSPAAAVEGRSDEPVTVMEVVLVPEGRLLISHRQPGIWMRVSGSDLVYALARAPGGRFMIDVRRVRLLPE